MSNEEKDPKSLTRQVSSGWRQIAKKTNKPAAPLTPHQNLKESEERHPVQTNKPEKKQVDLMVVRCVICHRVFLNCYPVSDLSRKRMYVCRHSDFQIFLELLLFFFFLFVVVVDFFDYYLRL